MMLAEKCAPTVKRGRGRPFPPGVSGNPGGRRGTKAALPAYAAREEAARRTAVFIRGPEFLYHRTHYWPPHGFLSPVAL